MTTNPQPLTALALRGSLRVNAPHRCYHCGLAIEISKTTSVVIRLIADHVLIAHPHCDIPTHRHVRPRPYDDAGLDHPLN